VGGLTGRVADLGISGRNGAVLAVEQSNARGGVRGRQVQLVVKDDEQDAETAVRVDKELIDAGVVAIIGHMTSAMSTVAVPLLDEHKVVMMSPTTTTDYLAGKDDYFFRVSSVTLDYASRMARYLRRTRGLESVAVAYDLGNEAYTESWYRDFRQEFEALGGKVAVTETFRSGPKMSFLELAQKLAVPAAQGVVSVASAMDTAMLAQQVRKLDAELPIAAAEWSATEKLIDLGGASVEGIMISQFFDRESTAPEYVQFREAYRGRFGNDPGFASVNAFDAVNVVLTALGRKGAGETLKQALLRIAEFPGVQGPVRIDRYGDGGRPTFLTTVRDGKFRVVQ
jgi:branched-chain amino acid transport system substrate-binding protein